MHIPPLYSPRTALAQDMRQPVPSVLRPRPLLLLLSAVLAASQAQAATKDGARNAADSGLLTATIAGEYALQAGRLDEASDWYLKAAHASEDDAGLAERATRIALLANQDAR